MLKKGVLALLGLSMGACSLFNQAHHELPPPAPPAPVVPATPPPVQTERFEIAPDQDIVGTVQTTHSTKDDTLTDIARRFNIGYEEITRANPKVDPWIPGDGTLVVLPTEFVLPNAPRDGVVINIAAMRLFYFPPHKAGEPQVVITHPIGIGKVGWSTPEGVTKIVRRQKDPKWTVPVSVIKEHRENGEELDRVVGPGPDNPLGRHAFYLQWPSYLIHGTNKPAGVGLRSSHGCIRLFPEDIAQLFDMVPIGTKVRVVNQPFVFGWQEGQLYMQPFDVLEDDTRDWKKAPKKLITQSVAATVQKQLKAQNEQINWDVVTAASHAPRGVPVPVSAADTSTDPVASIDQVLAKAALVLNQVPEGSTWDGKTDLPMDEGTFRQMLSEIDPNAAASAGGSAASGGASAPATSTAASPRSTTHVNTSAQASKTGS